MGRGRAKAKQTKVARQLKYSTGDLDVSRLSEELGAGSSASDDRSTDHDDPYVDKASSDEDAARS
ncbi:MAG: DUF3073 domain-containing protein [Candidatus Nanopelagicales bacterium]